MLPLVGSVGIVGVVVKGINDLADKELEYQVKYANCVKKKKDPRDCQIREVPAIARAVTAVSLLLLLGAAYLYFVRTRTKRIDTKKGG